MKNIKWRRLVIIVTLSFGINVNILFSQIFEVKSDFQYKYENTLPIYEGSKICGYIIFFRYEGLAYAEIEYVILDAELREIKRNVFEENYLSCCNHEAINAIKVDSTIYLKYQYKSYEDLGSTEAFASAFSFGLIGGILWYAISGNDYEDPQTKLEYLKIIDLSSANVENENLSVSSSQYLESKQKIDNKSLRDNDHIYKLQADVNGFLAIQSSFGKKNYFSNDTILKFDRNKNLVWKISLPTIRVGNKSIHAVVKEYFEFNEFVLVNVVYEINNITFKNMVSVYDKHSGVKWKDLSNHSYHISNEWSSNEHKFISKKGSDSLLIEAARINTIKNNKENVGILINIYNRNLEILTTKNIFWKDHFQPLPSNQKGYFDNYHDFKLNNIFWLEDRLVILLQKVNAENQYSDLIFITADDSLLNISVLVYKQDDYDQMDIVNLSNEERNITNIYNLNRKKQFVFKYVKIDDNKIKVERINETINNHADCILPYNENFLILETSDRKRTVKLSKLHKIELKQ